VRELTGSYRLAMLGVAAVMLLSAITIMLMTRNLSAATAPTIERAS